MIVDPAIPTRDRQIAAASLRRFMRLPADAVKQVVYVTDVRFQADVAKCRREAYGDGPIPANTFLVISALAIPACCSRLT